MQLLFNEGRVLNLARKKQFKWKRHTRLIKSTNSTGQIAIRAAYFDEARHGLIYKHIYDLGGFIRVVHVTSPTVTSLTPQFSF